MSTNRRSSQQSRYPMRERKTTRRKEVYRPEQDSPKISHSAHEERRNSSPLSSVRSDLESTDVHLRDRADQADIRHASAAESSSTARDEGDIGMSKMDAGNERRAQDRGRALATNVVSFEDMSLGDGYSGHESAAYSHREDKFRTPSHYHPQRPRSASPRHAEDTSYRSRSPFRRPLEHDLRTTRGIEDEKARIDQEAADFEAEYQQLLLEQSIQKRNYFKAKVEEQRLRMAGYTHKPQTLLVTASSPPAVLNNRLSMHPGRRARMDRALPSSPARSAREEDLKDFNPPAGPRSSFTHTHAGPLIEHNATSLPSPELRIHGTADTRPVPTLSPEPPLQSAHGLNAFQRRILATLSKGYAPRANIVPAPPHILRSTAARTLGNHRLFVENYGGMPQEDLALCRFVFDTPHECPSGKDCTCRHEPLDEEELEWIRTNPCPAGRNIEWHPGKWLERLLQNYSNPRMPKVSRFDRGGL